MSALLEIDGAAYSGSGMIVRQAVAYAAVTGTPVHLRHVRAHRPHPGLRRQHLCAVEAVRTLVGGRVEGASLGSREFTFCPAGEVPRGKYAFDVGTAGSATALSLALLPVLATAYEPVGVELTGGLFQDRAPSAFHLQHVLVPLLGRMGLAVTVTLVRPGYVPTGGGVLRLSVRRPGPLVPVEVERPGPVRSVWGIALASHLEERRVSRRMADGARAVLARAGHEARIEERDDTSALQPGAGLALFADLAGGWRLGADGAGAPGRQAEKIGLATAERLLEDLRTGAALDRFASDQIITFTALARGRSRTWLAAVTDHVRTGIWLTNLFGVARASLDGRLLVVEGGGPATEHS
ncbi:RNA 3'-terminal phosphate cyclase [Streptomyces chiangmaiensis]|uniref:RNA 3'-terminal phosphate cyclase n=1 Tax=Streptomyces chiangmaiensis TaxID=766497 RepID=A0ABU7FP11_9ACTN|nr:RNA 3'-terminal phosphate cyclase [Streptomyces chiangmaiensis]MED7825563.1 RNA 3'-terminal phosphate cyclase [Streptomyces chiangmaiensis]